MPNIKLIIEYDGSAYAGWQFQKDHITVQGEIEKALQTLLGVKTTLYGAGRTDAGAHALGQVANFHTDSEIPPDKLAPALQTKLNRDILIHSSEETPEDFHSRFSAKSRHYRYDMSFSRSALSRSRRWELPLGAGSRSLPLEKLQEAAELLRGKMNCETFCPPASRLEDNECEIFSANWTQVNDLLRFDICANRFLRGMIRSMVGLMVRYATGADNTRENSPALTLDDLRNIINSREWPLDQIVAPAHGLFLVEVEY